MNKHQIALQMYSVRELAQPDMLGTLRRVGAIGYPAVEFAGYGGVPTAEIRALLDSLGMQTAGAHVPLADLQDVGPARGTEPTHTGPLYVQKIQRVLEAPDLSRVCPWVTEAEE